MTPQPPKPLTFEKNELFEFSRGFARKIPRQVAEERFGLEASDDLVWLSPDGQSILSFQQAQTNNARRRSSLTMSDAWRDLKAVSPDVAQELGWNGFQRLNRGAQGSRVEILRRLGRVGIEFESLDQLQQAADGEPAENNGWGDSG